MVTVALILGAVLLLSHPFTGIRHDGTLYAGDALARLLPNQFEGDPYFQFGSQGRFTLLPTLYGGLISAFGLGMGTIVGMLAAFGLYLAATNYLVGFLVPKPLRLFCILSVVLGWTLYGGLRMFGYSEAFLTARSFAEPILLFGLGTLLRGHRLTALALLVVASAIHPLMGTSGLLVAWMLLVRHDRRWIALAVVGVLAVTILGLLQVLPVSDVFTRYDEQWLERVQDVNGQAFLTHWSQFDYGVILFDLAILWFVSRLGEGSVRPFVYVVVLAGLGTMLVSFIAVDLLHNPFFGKLQLWRALWIMQWTAMALLPIALHALWQRGEHGRVAGFLLALGWMAPFSVAPALLAVFAVLVYLWRSRFTVSAATTRAVGIVTILAGAIIAVQYEARVFTFGALFSQGFGAIVGQALAMNILLFGAALITLRALPKLGWGAPLVALAIFSGSLMVWDQRAEWTKKLESYPVGVHIWPGLIEADAKVYWYRDLIAPWVLLGHGNYYTQQQNSGAVFSRAMTIELDKRRKITGILDFQEQICRMMNALNEKQGSCEPDAEAVKTVCSEGGIDYIVLQSRLEGRSPLADFSTGVIENGYEKKFFLYRCSALKAG